MSSTFLLDSNACIKLLNGTSAPLANKVRQLGPSGIRLSAIVKSELLFGARKSTRVDENLALLERFFAPFTSLPFDDDCAHTAAIVRTNLARAGTPIGPNDLLIAATALAYSLTLVTHNTREFGRVRGLRLEDWE